jgi:hypothetical protein
MTAASATNTVTRSRGLLAGELIGSLIEAAQDHQRRMRAFGAANYRFGGER